MYVNPVTYFYSIQMVTITSMRKIPELVSSPIPTLHKSTCCEDQSSFVVHENNRKNNNTHNNNNNNNQHSEVMVEESEKNNNNNNNKSHHHHWNQCSTNEAYASSWKWNPSQMKEKCPFRSPFPDQVNNDFQSESDGETSVCYHNRGRRERRNNARTKVLCATLCLIFVLILTLFTLLLVRLNWSKSLSSSNKIPPVNLSDTSEPSFLWDGTSSSSEKSIVELLNTSDKDNNYDELETVEKTTPKSEDSESRSKDNSAKLDLKKVSRMSWNLLNSNQDLRDGGLSGGDELVLSSKMVFSSAGEKLDNPMRMHSTEEQGDKKRSCCRTEKYDQVVKREGCEPVTIVNKMCFGQCVSVWVPGLFASFPVCRPSKLVWRTVTLTCGRKRRRKRRVRVEKVKRCSCMEIESTDKKNPLKRKK